VSLLWLHFGESGCVAAALVLLFVFGRDSKLYILRCNISCFIICLKIDILYGCRTQIQKVKNMMDKLIIILPAIWVLFASYLVWYVTSAKRNVAITFNDAKALWHIHKKNVRCSGHKWRPISRKSGKISGFECECGYKYTQRRPILSGKPKNSHLDYRNQTAFSVTSY
jgi:hypothetical protein